MKSSEVAPFLRLARADCVRVSGTHWIVDGCDARKKQAVVYLESSVLLPLTTPEGTWLGDSILYSLLHSYMQNTYACTIIIDT